jgi:Nucleotidyl transferase AbiEii toxin, Type IV TA system
MTASATDPVELQRNVTRVALAGIAHAGFALAGSGAIREHRVIVRPTEDIDLFTTSKHLEQFDTAVGQVVADLRSQDYRVVEIRRTAHFARFRVSSPDDIQVDVDLGVDWRLEEPVPSEVGPMLSLGDAVGNKVSALYSRGEARDYVDIDAIRRDGRFTDEELIDAAADRDLGFDVGMFARQLDAARRLQPAQVARYGLGAEDLQAVKDRCVQWAAQLREESGH